MNAAFKNLIHNIGREMHCNEMAIKDFIKRNVKKPNVGFDHFKEYEWNSDMFCWLKKSEAVAVLQSQEDICQKAAFSLFKFRNASKRGPFPNVECAEKAFSKLMQALASDALGHTEVSIRRLLKEEGILPVPKVAGRPRKNMVFNYKLVRIFVVLLGV